MNKDDLNQKKELAREAMISPEQKERKKKRQESVDEKRYQAMLAMEGYERKRKREIKEAETKEAEAKEKIEKDKKRKEVDKLRAEKEAKEEKERQEELAKEETLEKRIKTAHRKGQLIEKLKLDKKSSLSAIRTFRRDLASATREGALTMAQIALKESAEKKSIKNIWPRISAIILTILLIAGGGLISYYAFIVQSKDITVDLPDPVASLILAESELEIELAGKNRNSLLLEIGRKKILSFANGTITNIFFSRLLGETKIFASFSDLVSLLELRELEEVTRNTSGAMMYGVFHENGNNPFLLINLADYEKIVAALLANEEILPKNLALFLGVTEKLNSEKYVFRDKLIRNQDTRIITDEAGSPIFIYSLIDRNTLLFTKDEGAFNEVVRRYKEGGDF